MLRYCDSLVKLSHPSGGKVVVGLNSDASIKRLKGESRPINNEKDRKLLLESLRFVDEVIIFHEDTPRDLIKKLGPDIVVKGGDWKAEQVSKIVDFPMEKIKIFGYIDQLSSSNIINRIKTQQ